MINTYNFQFFGKFIATVHLCMVFIWRSEDGSQEPVLLPLMSRNKPGLLALSNKGLYLQSSQDSTARPSAGCKSNYNPKVVASLKLQ